MKLCVPQYYKKFSCKGSSCSDNCCIGWEIGIDKKTEERYLSLGGELGDKIRKNLTRDGEYTHFVLSNDRCPMLDGDNLCSIIKGAGYGYLCEICDGHPRYFLTLGDRVFGGLGMCCEEAVRLILTEDYELCEVECSGFKFSDYDKELGDLVISEMTKLYISLKGAERVSDAIDIIHRTALSLQGKIDEENTELNTHAPLLSVDYGEIIGSAFSSLEYMKDSLYPLLCQSASVDLNCGLDSFMLRVIIYFVNRYFPKICEDGDAVGWCGFINLCALVCLRLLKLAGEDMDRCIEYLKEFSKEIEYCEENVDALRDYVSLL